MSDLQQVLKEKAQEYPVQFRPEHPRCDLFGFVGEHILVAETQLGRPLRETEVVHHLDHDKTNNTWPNNLLILTRKEHQQIPIAQACFLKHVGLLDEFVRWWQERKDNLFTEEQVLAQNVVKLENELCRRAHKGMFNKLQAKAQEKNGPPNH